MPTITSSWNEESLQGYSLYALGMSGYDAQELSIFAFAEDVKP
jgi:hypothetical protein